MSLDQPADCAQDFFTSASFKSGRPVDGLAEVIAEESGEHLKLGDRCLEQLPGCDHDGEFSVFELDCLICCTFEGHVHPCPLACSKIKLMTISTVVVARPAITAAISRLKSNTAYLLQSKKCPSLHGSQLFPRFERVSNLRRHSINEPLHVQEFTLRQSEV